VARVLVVDDDESIRDFVTLALSDEGYDVMTAPHGAAALSILGESRPDVILLDMRMPTMDGWEFSRVYRETPGPHAPIIVLTATRDVPGRAAQVESEGCLGKPFDVDELLSMVSRYRP
jgi:CheY-like chemotaxis protein